MKRKLFIFGKYFLLFLLFLLSYLFLPVIAADETWSYGFSYNVATGLVPYRDFNMIVPPFFSFLFAIGLVFYKGILMFHIEQALMMTFICYLLEKLAKEKYLLLVLALLVLAPMIYNLPSYNTLCLALVLLLIYLEKNENSDFMIGIILGLTFLTKQSIGGCVFLVGCYLVKTDLRRVLKRLLGFFVPSGLTVCYLIITGSFLPMIDQCILGMFDFSKNAPAFSIMPFLVLGVFVLFFFYFKKKKYDFVFFYALAFYSICIPLFDLSHFLAGLFILFFTFLAHSGFSLSFHVKLALWLLIFLIPILNCFLLLQKGVYPNDISNYEYRYLSEKEYHHLATLRDYYQKNKDKDIVILSSSAYIFKLSNHLKITKLDLINRGNLGVCGTEKIWQEIQKKDPKRTLYFVNEKEIFYDNQIDKEILRRVIKKGKKVDQVMFFDVYQLN